MPNLLRMLKMVGAFNSRIFEEEYVNIPSIVTNNDNVYTLMIT